MSRTGSCGALMLILAGCSAPTLDYRALPAKRVNVSERVFQVYAKGDEAQAVRVNRCIYTRPR